MTEKRYSLKDLRNMHGWSGFSLSELPKVIGPENIEKGVTATNLFELNYPQREELMKKVSANNGEAVIVIHPFYEEEHDYTNPEGKYSEFKSNLERTISNQDERPTIFFVPARKDLDPENRDVQRFSIMLALVGREEEAIYVPTDYDSSVPFFKDFEAPYPGSREWDEGWDKVASYLTGLGIQKIILKGRNLRYYEVRGARLNKAEKAYIIHKKGVLDNRARELIPVGCLGSAAVELVARGLDVEISEETYPNTKY